jgi:hypothetical protein
MTWGFSFLAVTLDEYTVLEDMDNILRRVLGEDIALDLLLDSDLVG